ncbi:MAG TPA: helix-turn-helix transcriptional regulator [Candidatus Faecisoma merdavium]|uniref:helix-turn-helix domain-containing protein n=1 Tax=Anaerofustis butyriciformans TaxID=3108533 RepID=UPI001F985B5E|nr:helix-turn-helix transcriptional regulator [Anaerofustis sp. HA2171]HIS11557.1 helix-turn-helix transcriptional regulator [Candidatus Onthocola stercoravium]HIS91141.1 helix-turn-helix transcriptional regulator [Candidatus Faecisoma merdavium]
MIIKNLRESRELIDKKQKDIAELMKVNFTTVSGWETGKDTIPLKRLIEYANYFNYSLDYLFGLTRTNDTNYLPLTINLDLIAKNLKLLRKKHNLTQVDVAKKINTTQASYAHYENAINLIPTTFLYNLTLIYSSFSIDELLGRKKQ